MPDMRQWINRSALVAPLRAEDAWSRIQDRPTEIALTRKDTVLPVQTVRVEIDSGTTAGEISGAAGQSTRRGVVIFGVKGHRLIPDTDIRRGDQFVHDGMHYRVQSVTFTSGEVQARAEALA